MPFKSNTTGESEGSELWEKLWHLFQYNRDTFLDHYHKRSNVESTMWMIKSKFDEHIRNKTDEGIVNELLCKVLCHNICVVIQSMYELGVEPLFWADGTTQKVEQTLCADGDFAHKVLSTNDSRPYHQKRLYGISPSRDSHQQSHARFTASLWYTEEGEHLLLRDSSTFAC